MQSVPVCALFSQGLSPKIQAFHKFSFRLAVFCMPFIISLDQFHEMSVNINVNMSLK